MRVRDNITITISARMLDDGSHFNGEVYEGHNSRC